MSYAIISVGGKQYRVREGERLLVDRLSVEDGATFQPRVLLLGGDGAPTIAPDDAVVTATVLGQEKGPKILIGKYKKRTGYKRHTGFRASLTKIQIESIGTGASGTKRATKSDKTAAAADAPAAAVPAEPTSQGLPEGYESLTVAGLKAAAASWDAETLVAALAFEQEHGKRKGAIAALEAAIAQGDH